MRGVAEDLVESVTLIDEYAQAAKDRTGLCYRLTYRHNDRSLTNEEIDKLQMQVRDVVQSELDITLR